tara:strand:+ start:1451 stop:1759 length:309 start_codon:yes stop_codon:yes gene_type:complete
MESTTLNLISLVSCIEGMNKRNQIKVLQLLKKNSDVVVNENQNGIHINVSYLSTTVIEELKCFVNYVKVQENELNVFEMEKESLQNTYFSKGNKEVVNDMTS